jgi:hypothetical protein
MANGQEYCFKYVVSSAANEFLFRRRNGEVIKMNTVTGAPITAGASDRITRVTDARVALPLPGRYTTPMTMRRSVTTQTGI